MKRLFDIAVSTLAMIVLSPVFLIVAILIKSTSKGPVFHVSDRIGAANTHFKMLKFRTMRTDAPQLPTHLMTNADQYITAVGRPLRRTSLDELPQLINVIRGDMSLVGPRPALFNQDDLIALRTSKGVCVLTPGVTGWAQTHGRDKIPIPEKVALETYYLKHRSFWLDMKILWLTVPNVVRRKNVAH